MNSATSKERGSWPAVCGWCAVVLGVLTLAHVIHEATGRPVWGHPGGTRFDTMALGFVLAFASWLTGKALQRQYPVVDDQGRRLIRLDEVPFLPGLFFCAFFATLGGLLVLKTAPFLEGRNEPEAAWVMFVLGVAALGFAVWLFTEIGEMPKYVRPYALPFPESAFEEAMARESLSDLRDALDRGADPRGKPPVVRAMEDGFYEAIPLLIERGATIDLEVFERPFFVAMIEDIASRRVDGFEIDLSVIQQVVRVGRVPEAMKEQATDAAEGDAALVEAIRAAFDSVYPSDDAG